MYDYDLTELRQEAEKEKMQEKFDELLGLISKSDEFERDFELIYRQYKDACTTRKRYKDKILASKESFMQQLKSYDEKSEKFKGGQVIIRETKSVEVFDDKILPEELKEIVFKPKRAEIKKALEKGQDVDGARLVKNESLTIKRK